MELTGMEHYILAKIKLKIMLRIPLPQSSEAGAEEGTTEPQSSEAGAEEGAESESGQGTVEEADIKLEDLEPILKLCRKAFSLTNSKAFYAVNGLLLSVVS